MARPDAPPPAEPEKPDRLPSSAPRLATPEPHAPASAPKELPAPAPSPTVPKPESNSLTARTPVPLETKEPPSEAVAGASPGSTGPPPTPAPAEAGGTVDRLAALRPHPPGGGLTGGRSGIEGEPVPLDTKDPKFSDYFERLRRAIKEKWSYPREAADKNIGGQLVLEFGIAKDGQLRFIELRRSSGVVVLDDYAVNAVKLASPFPPIPDEMSRTGIPVVAVFNYIIEGSLYNFRR
jgi:periplasmic protein TonB